MDKCLRIEIISETHKEQDRTAVKLLFKNGLAKQAYALQAKLSEKRPKQDCGIVIGKDKAYVEYNNFGNNTLEDIFRQIAKTIKDGGTIDWQYTE